MSSKTVKEKALPKGWRKVQLGEICFIDKETLSSETAVDYCFEYISLSDIEKGNLISTRKYKFSEAPSRARRIVKKGDVLLATVRPHLQGFYIFKGEAKDCIVSTGFAVLTAKRSFLEPAYLFQMLFSSWMLAIYHAFNVGSNYPAINSSDISKFKVCIPTLSHQKTIASLLETWDTAIEKTEALIAAKEKRFKWLLKTLISDQQNNPEWRKVKLGDVGAISSAGVDKKTVEGEEFVRLVNYLDVLRGDFILPDNLNHWVTAPERKTVQCNVRKGDIFFTPSSEIQGDIAHSAVSLEDIEKAVYSYHIVRFRLKEDWDLLFRGYVFKASNFYRQAHRLCDGSGQRYVISQDNLRKMIICIPDINEQKRIARILSAVQSEIDLLKQSVKLYCRQKRGLMQKLLGGVWRIKDV